MEIKEAIEHIQNRLGLMNVGARFTWSLEDRAAVSLVCMEAIQLRMQPTSRQSISEEDNEALENMPLDPDKCG